VLGTPDFMPPEQRRDAALVDARSDLWSLAATLYQMVTGRSPKIIRFDLLPPGLTSVLGKALEDGKEDRYQSAREFRDAIKTSLVASAPATAELGEGQCPACGVKNDSSRRFCRGCGEALEAPCLSCSKPMPMWEEICGQCGTKQAPLLEDRRGDMAARQAEAEGLIKDYDFDRAERLAVALRDEPDPRLKQLVPWATDFVGKIGEARDAQLAQAGSRLAEALKHEASFDYPSAVHALEQVPAILRSRPLEDHKDSVQAALDRVSAKQAEAGRLEGLVKARIAARELSGLLPEARRLQSLRPDRADIKKLCSQLEERQQQLAAQRDEAVALARSHLDAKDYESALAALRKVDRSVETHDVQDLRASTQSILEDFQALLADIRQAVTQKRLSGLIPKVERGLALKPGYPDLQKLLDSLHARESKVAASIEELVAEADRAFRECDFRKATATLTRIPETRRNEDVVGRMEACDYLGILKSSAQLAFAALPVGKDLAHATVVDLAGIARQGRDYLGQIAIYGLSDSAVEAACARCETAAEQAAARERRLGWLTAAGRGVSGLLAGGLAVAGSLARQASNPENGTRALKRLSAVTPVIATLAVFVVGVAGIGYWIATAWTAGRFTNSIQMQLVQIPAGTHYRKIKRVVLERTSDDLFIRKKVSIPNSFHIGSTEVTQEQWAAIMQSAPWKDHPNSDESPRQPVTHVTREEAKEFCRRLTSMERQRRLITDSVEYRLPTEDEWEYACRAGKASNYYGGEDVNTVATYDWCQGSGDGKLDHPKDVGLKSPTRWGVYDPFGNVREICSDFVRGGCWTDPPERCSTWRADKPSPPDGNESTGFRVILTNHQ